MTKQEKIKVPSAPLPKVPPPPQPQIDRKRTKVKKDMIQWVRMEIKKLKELLSHAEHEDDMLKEKMLLSHYQSWLLELVSSAIHDEFPQSKQQVDMLDTHPLVAWLELKDAIDTLDIWDFGELTFEDFLIQQNDFSIEVVVANDPYLWIRGQNYFKQKKEECAFAKLFNNIDKA